MLLGAPALPAPPCALVPPPPTAGLPEALPLPAVELVPGSVVDELQPTDTATDTKHAARNKDWMRFID